MKHLCWLKKQVNYYPSFCLTFFSVSTDMKISVMISVFPGSRWWPILFTIILRLLPSIASIFIGCLPILPWMTRFFRFRSWLVLMPLVADTSLPWMVRFFKFYSRLVLMRLVASTSLRLLSQLRTLGRTMGTLTTYTFLILWLNF